MTARWLSDDCPMTSRWKNLFMPFLCILMTVWWTSTSYNDCGFDDCLSSDFLIIYFFYSFFKVKVTSATPAIAFAILIFYLPQKFNFWPFVKSLGNVKSSGGLVDWNRVEQKMPWGVLLLLAGGMYQKLKKWFCDFLLQFFKFNHFLQVSKWHFFQFEF